MRIYWQRRKAIRPIRGRTGNKQLQRGCLARAPTCKLHSNIHELMFDVIA